MSDTAGTRDAYAYTITYGTKEPGDILKHSMDFDKALTKLCSHVTNYATCFKGYSLSFRE